MSSIINGRRLVGLTLLLVLLYVCWRGPERFWVESFGTWLLSPSIYVRILPQPLSNWLLTSLVRGSITGHLLYLAPIFLFVVAFLCAALSMWKNSLSPALVSLGIVTTIFVVYHFVQPLGISCVYF